MRKCGFLCAVLIAGLAGLAAVQDQASTTIQGKTIAIKYSAPSMKGRKIFGETVPYNKVWRIGDNSAATLHTDSDLVFSGIAALAAKLELAWESTIASVPFHLDYAADREW